MRKIVLNLFGAALIAAPAAVAAQPHHLAPHRSGKAMRPIVDIPLCDAQGAVLSSRAPSWPYSGWSAPGGRGWDSRNAA